MSIGGGGVFLSLFVRLPRDLYFLPEGRSWKKPWPGCDGSLIIIFALFSPREVAMFSREGRGQQMIFPAVLITPCRVFFCLWLCSLCTTL